MTSDKKADNLLSSREIVFFQMIKDSKLHSIINTEKTEEIRNNTYEIFRKNSFSQEKSYDEYHDSYLKAFEFHRKYNTKLSMKILNNTKQELLEFIEKSK